MKHLSTRALSEPSPKKQWTPSHNEIAALAATLWQQKGCPMDRDEEIWLEAESQLGRTHGLPRDNSGAGPEERMDELDDIYPSSSGRETTSL